MHRSTLRDSLRAFSDVSVHEVSTLACARASCAAALRTTPGSRTELHPQWCIAPVCLTNELPMADCGAGIPRAWGQHRLPLHPAPAPLPHRARLPARPGALPFLPVCLPMLMALGGEQVCARVHRGRYVEAHVYGCTGSLLCWAYVQEGLSMHAHGGCGNLDAFMHALRRRGDDYPLLEEHAPACSLP